MTKEEGERRMRLRLDRTIDRYNDARYHNPSDELEDVRHQLMKAENDFDNGARLSDIRGRLNVINDLLAILEQQIYFLSA